MKILSEFNYRTFYFIKRYIDILDCNVRFEITVTKLYLMFPLIRMLFGHVIKIAKREQGLKVGPKS